jgi:hypothetical protein
MYIFPLLCFKHHGQVHYYDVYDATPKKFQKKSLIFFPFFLVYGKKSMLKKRIKIKFKNYYYYYEKLSIFYTYYYYFKHGLNQKN